MSVVAILTIFPISGEQHLGPIVAEAVEIIRESGLDYRLGPMATALEGDFETIMDVASACMRAMEQHSDRVYMTLTVDSKKDGEGRLDSKVQSVEKALAARQHNRESGKEEQ